MTDDSGLPPFPPHHLFDMPLDTMADCIAYDKAAVAECVAAIARLEAMQRASGFGWDSDERRTFGTALMALQERRDRLRRQIEGDEKAERGSDHAR